MTLRLHSFLPHSRANGPGVRSVIWVQGCSLGCPGCFNPETHEFERGETVTVDELARRIIALDDSIEGITISGGEPLQQRPALSELLRRVKSESDLSAIVFTGFAWEEVMRLRVSPLLPDFLNSVDVLIAGRYDENQRLGRGLRGSANKTVHCLTNRYTAHALESVPPAEVIVTSVGELVFSGIQPVTW